MGLTDGRFDALKQAEMLGNNHINMSHVSDDIEDSSPVANANGVGSSKPLHEVVKETESVKVIPL